MEVPGAAWLSLWESQGAYCMFDGFDSRTREKKDSTPDGVLSFLEQGTGVEPAFTAWEAVVLPIYEPCVLGVL